MSLVFKLIRDLDSNSAYTKNEMVSWPDGKSNHHRVDVIGSNVIITIYIKNLSNKKEKKKTRS